MLTDQQEILCTTAQSVIERELAASSYLPCFALATHSDGQVEELVPQCEPGQEDRVFEELVLRLKAEVASGATHTALVILLVLPSDGSTTGATVDLDRPTSHPSPPCSFVRPNYSFKPRPLRGSAYAVICTTTPSRAAARLNSGVRCARQLSGKEQQQEELLKL